MPQKNTISDGGLLLVADNHIFHFFFNNDQDITVIYGQANDQTYSKLHGEMFDSEILLHYLSFVI